MARWLDNCGEAMVCAGWFLGREEFVRNDGGIVWLRLDDGGSFGGAKVLAYLVEVAFGGSNGIGRVPLECLDG